MAAGDAPVDFSDLINKTTGGDSSNMEIIFSHKDFRPNTTTTILTASIGREYSYWNIAGQRGSWGAVPGSTARNPTNSTDGAIGQANASGGRNKWLYAMDVSSVGNAMAMFFLYDRLADISGLSGTNVGTQSTTDLSVSRYTGAESAGSQIAIEIYTAVGTTAQTITATYTNQAGQGGQVTQASPIGGAGVTWPKNSGTWIPLPLQQGDTGVRSVESVLLSGSTGTVGDFGVTIYRPLACGAGGSNGNGGVAAEPLLGKPGPILIKSGACLAWYGIVNASASIEGLEACLRFVES